MGKEYADYVVLDPAGRKIGHVKESFTNARGEPEYILMRVGFFRMSLCCSLWGSSRSMWNGEPLRCSDEL